MIDKKEQDEKRSRKITATTMMKMKYFNKIISVLNDSSLPIKAKIAEVVANILRHKVCVCMRVP